MAVILVMLGTLALSYGRLQPGAGNVTIAERLCVVVAFSPYFGWLTVATILNVAVTLAAGGWGGAGLGSATWGILLIVAASLMAQVMYYNFRDPVYELMFSWTFVAIAVAQASFPGVAWTGGGGPSLPSLP